MKSFILKIIILLSLIYCANISFAQITIESGLVNNDISVFFINDFDFTQSGNSPLLFWVEITNAYPDSQLVSLKLSISYNSLASGEIEELASGETEPFNLPPSPPPLRIDNQNMFSQASKYKLKDYNINKDAADELLNAILASGKLPSGTYEFHLEIINANTGNVNNDDTIELEISNPTTLDLISPGELASSSEPPEIYTTLPLFQWESDASQFRFTVCEKLSTNNSPEDVMDNEPRIEKIIETTTFQYPSTGAFTLEEGKTYFWQVVAITQSSSGPIEMESEIWGFKIANFSSGATSAYHMQIVNILKSILGDDVVDNLFTENGELANFTSTGVILKNGVSISMEELNALIQEMLTGKVKIKGYTVE